jgi:hypothetical protein
VELSITAAVDLLLGTPPIDGDHAPVVSRDNGEVKLLCAMKNGTAHVVWFTPPAKWWM